MANTGSTADVPSCRYGPLCYRTDPDHKLKFSHPVPSTASNKPGISLKGKAVVFTGVLAQGTRKQATARAKAHGCVVKTTVSATTDIVVVGEQPGKKVDLAEYKGVTILTEDDWEELLCQSAHNSVKRQASDNGDDSDEDTPSPKKTPKKGHMKTEECSNLDNKPPQLRRQRTHNLSDSESEGEKESPKKYKLTPNKGEVSPSSTNKGNVSPNKGTASPNKGTASPNKGTASPNKGTASPNKGTASPNKDTAPPNKGTASPNKDKAPKCKYWDKCYRKDPDHLKSFQHPLVKTADDGSGEGTSSTTDDITVNTTPQNLMAVGDTVDVGAYRIKRVSHHYYCTCMGWKTQGGPVNQRTCKHLKQYLGKEFEKNRCQLSSGNTHPPVQTASPIKSLQLLLAQKWEEKVDPTGWWLSEKLDGVRAYWNGKSFYSRLGNPFYAPAWFTQGLPSDLSLDGELFGGRGDFQSTVSIVKTPNSAGWKHLTYQIFDAPGIGSLPFENRLEKLKEALGNGSVKYASMVKQRKCTGTADLEAELEQMISLGGEGVMLRQPLSQYEHKRSNTLLKHKKFYDAEARVIGHEKGKGRNSGRCGALRCEMACGKHFSCGSGLTDKDRDKPPKIGSIITYKFQEYTNDGIPRFPTYLGPRVDLDEPSDAKVTGKPSDN